MGALKTKDDIIIVEAVHESKNEDGSSNSRKFTKEFKMPAGVVTKQLASTYSGAGILTVSAPRQIQAPEGAEVSEAMKAQSQAFVTEDGTAVKKDEKASNQSIAATTQSEDGSTISSFKSTSSSSSSMMSSGGGAMPSMGSMGSMGGMGGMSLMGGGSNMDDMMSKMMSNMGSMQMGSSSSKMSSSSVSSFSSSSSSSSMMSSNMSSMLGVGSGGMSLPPMRGMEMPGFPSMPGMTIEEMPSAASTPAPASETPYTVTSPMSPRTHKVGASEDYKAPSATDSDTSVLLQYKEGSDYKLALNMQQYSPDDITI